MIDSEDWHWVLRLGIIGAVPMVIVALLEEGVVSGLMEEERGSCFICYFIYQFHNILEFCDKFQFQLIL